MKRPTTKLFLLLVLVVLEVGNVLADSPVACQLF